VEQARPAEGADAQRCGELCRLALDSLQGVRGGALFARREARLVATALLRPGGLLRLLADGRRRVLVGTLDGVVVGMGLGRIDEVGDATLGVVDGLYVEPDARRVGVGRAVLDDLTAWFAVQGCGGVDVATLPGDRATKNLLEGAGFKARLLTLHRPLP
jgi:GNAT superfamily N-acetyltransferase